MEKYLLVFYEGKGFLVIKLVIKFSFFIYMFLFMIKLSLFMNMYV